MLALGVIVFFSTHGTSPLDTSREMHQVMAIEKSPDASRCPLRGIISPQLKTTVRVISVGVKLKNGRLMISLWSETPSELVLGAGYSNGQGSASTCLTAARGFAALSGDSENISCGYIPKARRSQPFELGWDGYIFVFS